MSDGVLPTWTVVMPVKALSGAKSRMDPERGGAGGALALAFFLDTATAILASDRVAEVVVATADPTISGHARGLGCTVVDDTGHAGINAAAAWAAGQRAGTGPVAVVVSDLPCLTPESVTDTLDGAVGSATSFLPDADGTGTTMWMVTDGRDVSTRFGPASAAAHSADGATDLSVLPGRVLSVRRARRDVDTESDLVDARRLGVGPHTRAALNDSGSPSPVMVTALGLDQDGRLCLADEQGGRHVIDRAVAEAAGFLEVRPGQRLILLPGSPPAVTLP